MPKELVRHVGLAQESTHHQLLLPHLQAWAAVYISIQMSPIYHITYVS